MTIVDRMALDFETQSHLKNAKIKVYFWGKICCTKPFLDKIKKHFEGCPDHYLNVNSKGFIIGGSVDKCSLSTPEPSSIVNTRPTKVRYVMPLELVQKFDLGRGFRKVKTVGRSKK